MLYLRLVNQILYAFLSVFYHSIRALHLLALFTAININEQTLAFLIANYEHYVVVSLPTSNTNFKYLETFQGLPGPPGGVGDRGPPGLTVSF